MEFFIIAIFILSIARPLVFKVCAHQLDHQTAPIFTSFFTLIGILITLPFFKILLSTGLQQLLSHPIALGLCIIKGIIFWYGSHEGQKMAKISLSSTHYIMPLGLSCGVLTNSFLGEILSTKEWISIIGLCTIGIAFFLKGHLSELDRSAKILYTKLVLICGLFITIDHYTILHSNWYSLLFISSLSLFITCVTQTRQIHVWKSALFNKTAIIAGTIVTLHEFVKFYPMVIIMPVSTVALVESSTTPIILILSALLWKERKWKEQLIWGLCSVLFISILIL